MDYEIFTIFKNYSLEAILIASGSFLLTYLIKIPIKKKTAQLEENKRKMVNVVILFIPLCLSFVFSVLYYGITKNQWVSLLVLDSTLSSWLISLSMYAIVSRIWLVIKGIKSGNLQINPELTKQTISYIKDTLQNLNSENKNETKKLQDIVKELSTQTELRNEIANDTVQINLDKLAEINANLSNLETQKKNAEQKIESNNQAIARYNEKLYIKK